MKKLSLVAFATLGLSLLAILALDIASVSAVGSITDGVESARGTQQPADLFGNAGVFSTITNVLLFIIGAIAVIMIIVGGIRYVISGGDSSQVQAAKNTILYALVGVIVAILAYAVVNFVVDSFVPSGTTGTSSSSGASTR